MIPPVNLEAMVTAEIPMPGAYAPRGEGNAGTRSYVAGKNA
jgi:hypothetical protein